MKFKNTYVFIYSTLFLITFFSYGVSKNIYAQTSTSTATSSVKIVFPYDIQFTTDELKKLQSLDQATIDKLVQIAKLTKEQNIAAAEKRLEDQRKVVATTAEAERQKQLQQANNIQNYGQNSNQYGTNQSQPTLFSNQPTQQTPYYNSQTGQYQNTPSNSQSNSTYENPYLANTNNPYLNSVNQNTQNNQSSILFNLVNIASRGNTNMDLSKLNFEVVCKATGFEGGILNPNNKNWENVNKKLKDDVIYMSSVIGKKPMLTSGWRSQKEQDRICNSGGTGAKACGSGGSRHSQGLAVDLTFVGFSKEEKRKAILILMSKGWSIGGYGENGHVHIGLDGGETNWRRFGTAPSYVLSAFELSAAVNGISRADISKRANLALGKFCAGN